MYAIARIFRSAKRLSVFLLFTCRFFDGFSQESSGELRLNLFDGRQCRAERFGKRAGQFIFRHADRLFEPAKGELGGWVSTPGKKEMPGPQTTWIGLQRVQDFARAWKIFGPDTQNRQKDV